MSVKRSPERKMKGGKKREEGTKGEWEKREGKGKDGREGRKEGRKEGR